MRPTNSRLPDLALLLLTAGWGTTFLIIQAALQDVQPQAFLALRFTFGAASLLAWMLWRGRLRDLKAMGRGTLLGVSLYAGYALQTEGLVHTTAARSAFITGLAVLLIPFLSWAINGRRPSMAAWAGVGLALAGLVFLTRPWDGDASGTWLGDLLTLGCAFGFAGQNVGTERWASRSTIESLLLPQLVVCGLFAFAGARFEAGPSAFTGHAIFVAALCGILFTTVAFAVATWALRRTTATRAALIFSLEPVFAALYAALFYGVLMTKAELLGAGLILAGVLLGELGPALAPRAQAEASLE
ncbi:MAG TPA: DMT family transporter [Vulgatibacter sp.]